MKRITFVPALLLSLSLLSGVQAADLKDASQKNDAKKDQYEQSMEERFRRLGRSLDELHARAQVLAEQARRDAERSLAEAEKQRKKAGQKLEELRTESRKRWAKFSEELNAAMDEFEKAYDRAKEHFKE